MLCVSPDPRDLDHLKELWFTDKVSRKTWEHLVVILPFFAEQQTSINVMNSSKIV
jgi:hypothetical protein